MPCHAAVARKTGTATTRGRPVVVRPEGWCPQTYSRRPRVGLGSITWVEVAIRFVCGDHRNENTVKFQSETKMEPKRWAQALFLIYLDFHTYLDVQYENRLLLCM